MTEEKHIGSANPFDKDFNWFLFFEQPVEDISYYALVEAKKLASNWVTCACGQLCKTLPRGTVNSPDEPKDEELSELGYRFHNEIEEAWYRMEYRSALVSRKVYLANAKDILVQIEQRTNQLLNAIQPNQS
jgi:hypothetical protein